MEPADDETIVNTNDTDDADTQDPAGADAASVPGADVAKLREERDYYLDQVQRTRADLENIRKRAGREREQMTRRVTVDVFRDVLPIIDDLQAALRSADDGAGQDRLLDGLRLISAKFDQVLERYAIAPVESVGYPFDPNCHEAMFHEETRDAQEGSVLAEFERGYRLGEDLIRPARVKVAKAPPTGDA